MWDSYVYYAWIVWYTKRFKSNAVYIIIIYTKTAKGNKNSPELLL